ncbi:hypothetical protein D3C80_1016580 [compost metagenome]
MPDEVNVCVPAGVTVTVPEPVAGEPLVPEVAIEYETVAVGVPEIVIVFAVVFFTKVNPEAGNPVTAASVAVPLQVNTIDEIAVPLTTV